MAMRLSGVMNSDQGVAVAALVEQRQVQLQRRPPVALGDDARAGASTGVSAAESSAPRPLRGGMEGRGRPDRIDARRPCALEELEARAGGAPRRSSPSASRLRRIAAIAAAEESTSVASDGPPRERLDRQRARAGEQVEHPRPVDVAEDREQRLAHPVRRRADLPARAARARPRAPPRTPRSPARAHARIGAAASGAVGRSSASASSACSGSASSGSSPAIALGVRPRALEQLRVPGSSATRNWARPCWRVPSSSPSPRSSRSISASSKPVASRRQRPQPRRVLGAEQQAHRRVLAAADPAAQLMQLRDPVALGVLDEHHGRVRHVDPDLDHRRRDEHVGAARRERRHRLLLLAPAASARAAARTRKSLNSLSRRRSNSAVAARACSTSDSSTRAGRRRTPGARRAAPRGCARTRARARARSSTRTSDRPAAARQLAQHA